MFNNSSAARAMLPEPCVNDLLSMETPFQNPSYAPELNFLAVHTCMNQMAH